MAQNTQCPCNAQVLYQDAYVEVIGIFDSKGGLIQVVTVAKKGQVK